MVNNISLDLDQFPQSMSEDELRVALTDRDNLEWARLAFKTLSQRQSELVPDEARSILKDVTVPEDLHSLAAVELGKCLDANSEQVLIGALSSATPGLLKHVAKSLGQIGGQKALEKLEQTHAPDDSPAGIALRFARALISYRLGLNTHLLEPKRDARPLTPETTERTNIEFRKLDKAECETAWPLLRRQLPAISVDAERGLRFLCGGSEHWIVLNEAIVRADAADVLRKRPMIAGAIFKHRACSAQYSLDEYILTNGGGNDSVLLLGVRPSGVMVHAGSVGLREHAAKFKLLSNNPPYSRPIDLRGDFDPTDGHLSFSQVLVGTSWKIAARPSVPKRRVFN